MTCKGDCIGYEIALDPWRGGCELVIQLSCFEQLQELASQCDSTVDLGKHEADDCLCQLPEDIVRRVVGEFVMKKAAEGLSVTITTMS